MKCSLTKNIQWHDEKDDEEKKELMGISTSRHVIICHLDEYTSAEDVMQLLNVLFGFEY